MDGRPLPPDETPLFRAVRGEVVSNERWRVHRPDGQWRTLEGTASPLRQPDGTPVGGVLIAHDVTQQQEAESERERLLRALEAERSRLEEAVRIREDLVAVVSHDLRNPISAISMSASVLLKREELSAGQARGLGRIYSSADRALRMIRDLLDSTQARVGGIPVAPKPLDFHELARNVVEEVQLAHPERHILFHTMGDARGAWDADRMAQVITNLVGNAVQHSPLDSPVRVESCGLEGEVQLRVHNEGSPIPVEDIPTLFEPFRRGRGAGGAPGSVGLGLFITRQVVEAHGGIIEARSQQGEGTLFTVRFSRARMPAPSAA
ncbi:MAG: ATP-binding protein, partial [Cystobacter sp.]